MQYPKQTITNAAMGHALPRELAPYNGKESVLCAQIFCIQTFPVSSDSDLRKLTALVLLIFKTGLIAIFHIFPRDTL